MPPEFGLLRLPGSAIESSATRALALASFACVMTVAVFGAALAQLVARWNIQEEYSHGYLIPVVSAWLLWKRRDVLQPAWEHLRGQALACSRAL